MVTDFIFEVDIHDIGYGQFCKLSEMNTKTNLRRMKALVNNFLKFYWTNLHTKPLLSPSSYILVYDILSTFELIFHICLLISDFSNVLFYQFDCYFLLFFCKIIYAITGNLFVESCIRYLLLYLCNQTLQLPFILIYSRQEILLKYNLKVAY